MKRLILFELILLFLATTFHTDTQGWVQQTVPTTKPITDLFFIDSLHGWATVSSGMVYDSGEVIATTNGGINWVTQFTKDTLILNAIQFLNLNTGYCVGGYQMILKTINGGQNWINMNSPGSEYFTDLFFVNPDTGWICDPHGFGGVFKTTNSGVNWAQQMAAGTLPNKLFFLNKDTGWAGSSDWKLYRTTNSGLNWSLQYTSNTAIGSIFFLDAYKGWIRGGTGNGVLYTTDGGFNWQNAQGNTSAGFDIKFVNDSIGYSGSGFQRIAKSTNGGKYWGYQNIPISDALQTVFFSNDTTIGYAGSTGLIKTTDGGGPFVGIHQISSEVPKDFRLYQNYPNPFNPNTNIKYDIKRQTSNVSLIVFDITGKEITTLVNQKQNAGTYEINFSGNNLSSGIYFYKLLTESYSETRKMVLLK